jgi:hypothetical protein
MSTVHVPLTATDAQLDNDPTEKAEASVPVTRAPRTLRLAFPVLVMEMELVDGVPAVTAPKLNVAGADTTPFLNAG